MKIFSYLFAACVLLGLCACHDENADNDDAGSNVPPVVSFKEKSVSVAENAGTLSISLILTKAVEARTVVNVSLKEGTHSGGLAGAPYATIPSEVILEKGATGGVLTLQIVDNQTPNRPCSFQLGLTGAGGGVQVDTAACHVTITDDEIDHMVRFGPERDTVWPEEAGIIEIPLIIKYGSSPDRKVSGKITVDNYWWCTPDDFELLTTDFTANGEDTLKVRLRLVDNQEVDDWKVKLRITDLQGGAWILSPEYEVKVKSNDLVLGFQAVTYAVDEGGNIDIVPYLFGGLASASVPLSVEVVADQTTALPVQYSIPNQINPINKNTQSSSFALTTNKNAGRSNKVLALKVTTTLPGILYDTTQICRVTIRNTDPFVRFAAKELIGLGVGITDILLETSGYNEDVIVYVSVKSSTMNTSDYRLVSDFVRIREGQKIGRISLKITAAMKPGDQIVLEISRVVLTSSGTANEEIDTDNNTCTCRGAK